MNYYGQLDITKLNEFLNEHPECFKKVKFKDGEHTLIQVEVREKKQADQHGNVAYIQTYSKGERAYIADLKESQFNDKKPMTKGEFFDALK